MPKIDKKYRKKLEKEILNTLYKNSKQSFNYKQLASQMQITDMLGKQMLADSLFALAANKKISEESKGKFRYIKDTNTIKGEIDITKHGRGFLITEGEAKDIPISNGSTGQALSRDTVSAKVVRRKNGKIEAKVVDIIQRFKTKFTGVLQLDGAYGFVIVSDKKVHTDFFIKPENLNGAKNGEKVVIEFLEWIPGDKCPLAKVTDVLGMPGSTETEIHAILEEFDLPYAFSDEVLEDANRLKDGSYTPKEVERVDYREVLTFTIDPHDAKDFDDALSYKKLDNGNTEVGIHIADVSFYLEEGSVLDDEAIKRATSVYLVDRVIPMLPEVLSNELCSLRPNEDKYCYSAIFELNDAGKVLEERFCRTIIHSDKRYAYEDAQAIIEGGEDEHAEAILKLDAIAKNMRNERVENGAIEFGSQEMRFTMEDGIPVGVTVKTTKDSNKLIEEYMLLANKRVAYFIGETMKRKNIYRIHDLPDEDKLNNFKKFVKNFGIRFQASRGEAAAKAMNKVLAEVKDQPYETVVKELAVRCMAKAVYSTDNIGHYGLAFDHYSHFTSPIRRYPDVLVHRILTACLNDVEYKKEGELEWLSKHCSDKEKQATEAERESIKYMQVKFMQDRVGKELYGTVSGLSKWGFYVKVDEYYCEGMVPLKSYNDDFLTFDENKFEIYGKRTGMTIGYGDRVLIHVKEANLYLKQIDFELISVID
jgi:ribonuclease R